MATDPDRAEQTLPSIVRRHINRLKRRRLGRRALELVVQRLRTHVHRLKTEELPRMLCMFEQTIRDNTRSLFAVDPDFEFDFDPENPDDQFIVVNVKVAGLIDELLERQQKWHEQLRGALPEEFAWNLRLHILPIS